MTRPRPNLRVVKPEPARACAPVQRGYAIAYDGPGTRCPACHRSNWYVRRLTAECAFCQCALPIGSAHG
jgi:hypothetical protein